ncbi:DNA topoisomerase IB [Pseudobacter ginsenosidimutans]|uniref:DNA topoisomerase-1 n=1 Tax=Pseudobacter ginsenosidimutans TaxID=661488 RepID=A0A4Q7N1B3_9BACT|nr:DNA topoisomerase IB [Pseudobacter ginsenosidimutans]RZS74399.1 DNA topoisomerase-1 [Pseudobacter ginsenosidimutans]
MQQEITAVDLSDKELLELHRDYQSSAEKVSLVYVEDSIPGIRRKKAGKGFTFIYNEKRVTEKSILNRIHRLAIPPAWSEVWICPKENGHLQATGKDIANRKQYRYHSQWAAWRNETKFHRLPAFGKVLPFLRKQVQKDMAKPELTEEKVIATVINLMEKTYIRIGSSDYEKLYGSYGLTTMKDNHVKVNGSSIQFTFKGKKGILHKISVRNKRLAEIVQACKDIPGKELFQYFDAEGNHKSIDSGMVNNYIRNATGGDFTSKDFRTWAGTLNMLRTIKSFGDAASMNERKKNVLEALDKVSALLGNTRAVCRKYYVHPGVIRMYEEDSLKRYLVKMQREKDEEKVMMTILKKLHA